MAGVQHIAKPTLMANNTNHKAFLTAKRITMLIISMALFMDVLDSNIVNTAVPAMSQTFNVSPIDLKIALISYLLSLALFIPTSGWAADQYGAKPVFIAAMGLFTLTSFFCGYAHTLVELVIARFIQGMGGAFMISLGRLIIAQTFKRYEFVEAMNVIIIVVSVATMMGPFIGGVIVDHLSWPWIFWVNIPAGLLAIIVSIIYLKDPTIRSSKPFDLIGFILFAGSITLFCFSLAEISNTNSNLNSIFLRIIIALLTLIVYFFYAKKKAHPVIKTELFKTRTFRISVIGSLCSRLGFGGMPFLLPLLQQIGFGFSAQLSGLLLMPIAFGIILSKIISIKILRKIGYKYFLLINTFLVSISLCSFQFITIQTPIYIIALFTFIFGVFISAQFTSMNSLALADIKDEHLSASTSITSTVQILGQSLGVAVAAILLRFFSSRLHQKLLLSPAIFHHAFIALGIITLFSAFIFMFLKLKDGEQMLIKKL